MLLAGVGLIGLALLTPTALQVARLRAERMAAEAEVAQLSAHTANYRRFIASVEAGDPALMQRLAWHELHLKPAGAQMVDLIALPAQATGHGASYEPWLRAVHVEPAAAAASASPTESKLVRWATGRRRMVLFIAGGVLVGLGLLSSLRDADED